jgi:hypothetical protein
MRYSKQRTRETLGEKVEARDRLLLPQVPPQVLGVEVELA